MRHQYSFHHTALDHVAGNIPTRTTACPRWFPTLNHLNPTTLSQLLHTRNRHAALHRRQTRMLYQHSSLIPLTLPLMIPPLVAIYPQQTCSPPRHPTPTRILLRSLMRWTRQTAIRPTWKLRHALPYTRPSAQLAPSKTRCSHHHASSVSSCHHPCKARHRQVMRSTALWIPCAKVPTP